jgi:DNA-binding Lrp family transcriptional regulator|tara:strand:- start:113 stop:343 length:231 start_codon:yes stop_codon:yes gene_type:complete
MPRAFVLLNVDLGSEEEVLQEIKTIDGVIEAHRVYGVYDTVVVVEMDSTEKLKEVVTWKIRRLSKVRSTLTMIAIK